MIVQSQFDLFWIDHNKFKLGRMLFVEQGSNDGVQSYGFSLSRCPGNQQVGHFCQFNHVGFIGYGFSKANGQFEFGFPELL